MITLIVGISGSGKSTLAKHLASKNKNLVVLNRDKIREMNFGHTEATIARDYWSQDKKIISACEKDVTYIQDAIIKSAILDNKDVLLDETNLDKKFIEKAISKWNRFTDIRFHILPADLAVSIERDALRTRTVGEQVIKDQYTKYINLLASDFSFADRPCVSHPIKQNKELPSCVIFDIDGTLAEKGDRFAFDWSKVGGDTVRENVKRSLQFHLERGDHVVICTGRDGSCEDITKKWLAKFDIRYHEYHTRTPKDNRPDWAIKEELWREISTRFNIKLLYDDRDQVVEHARQLGLEVYQVQPGRF